MCAHWYVDRMIIFYHNLFIKAVEKYLTELHYIMQLLVTEKIP